MALPRPPNHIDWTDGDAAKVFEPPAPLKAAGWTATDKPAFQHVNWLLYYSDLWLKHLDNATAGIKARFDAKVGVTVSHTHTSVQAAIDDLVSNATILVAESATLSSAIHPLAVNDNITLVFKDGVTYTYPGTIIFNVDSGCNHFRVYGGRFDNPGAGEMASVSMGAAYCSFFDIRLTAASPTKIVDVEDTHTTLLISGAHHEA